MFHNNDWIKNLFQLPGILNKKEIAETPKHSQQEQSDIIAHLRSMNTDVANKLADEMENNFR